MLLDWSCWWVNYYWTLCIRMSQVQVEHVQILIKLTTFLKSHTSDWSESDMWHVYKFFSDKSVQILCNVYTISSITYWIIVGISIYAAKAWECLLRLSSYSYNNNNLIILSYPLLKNCPHYYTPARRFKHDEVH